MNTLDDAFRRIGRADFLPDLVRGEADIDAPLPIGFGQTNSQPSTVRMMLEWLEVEPDNTVLDVGSGSGWTTALLSHLAGSGGMVYGVETVPELAEFGRANCAKYGLKNVRFYEAGSNLGLPEYAPYDRILVSASGSSLPQALLDQLKPGGKMVIPIHTTVHEIAKLSDGRLETTPHTGFVFVPLV